MPNTRLMDRSGVKQHAVGTKSVAFTDNLSSHSHLVGEGGADDLSGLLAQFPEVNELGRPGMTVMTSVDLSAATTHTLPAGVWRRIIGGLLVYTASADAATRTPILTLNPATGDAFETITFLAKTANDHDYDHFLMGSDGNVSGSRGVAAVGKLTIAEQITAGDTMTIGSTVYTFIAAGADPTAAQSPAINLGATEAATKENIEAKFVDGQHPLVNAVAFNGDDMLFTARNPGVAGDAIVFTETFTHANNVMDGSGTIGGTTAGVDPAIELAVADYPDMGALLDGGDKITLTTTNGHANDEMELYIFYVEFDNDPR